MLMYWIFAFLLTNTVWTFDINKINYVYKEMNRPEYGTLNLTISVFLATTEGTVAYVIDAKHAPQFRSITLKWESNELIAIENIDSLRHKIRLKDECGVAPGSELKLVFELLIKDNLWSISCNSRKKNEYNYKDYFNKTNVIYPLPRFRERKMLYLWMGQLGLYQDFAGDFYYPAKSMRLKGCLRGLWLNNVRQQINTLNTEMFKSRCIYSCESNKTLCHGGKCVTNPMLGNFQCDCTYSLRNGPLCNSKLQLLNKSNYTSFTIEAKERTFLALKLSLNTKMKIFHLIQIKSSHLILSITMAENGNVVLRMISTKQNQTVLVCPLKVTDEGQILFLNITSTHLSHSCNLNKMQTIKFYHEFNTENKFYFNTSSPNHCYLPSFYGLLDIVYKQAVTNKWSPIITEVFQHNYTTRCYEVHQKAYNWYMFVAIIVPVMLIIPAIITLILWRRRVRNKYYKITLQARKDIQQSTSSMKIPYNNIDPAIETQKTPPLSVSSYNESYHNGHSQIYKPSYKAKNLRTNNSSLRNLSESTNSVFQNPQELQSEPQPTIEIN